MSPDDIKKALLRNEMGTDLPEGTFQVGPLDLPKIRALGKELLAFIYGYAQKEGELPTRILVGGFDFVTTIVMQRKKILADHFGDELLLAMKTMDENNLAGLINEPFQDRPQPKPPTTVPSTPEGIADTAAAQGTVPPATDAAAAPAEAAPGIAENAA